MDLSKYKLKGNLEKYKLPIQQKTPDQLSAERLKPTFASKTSGGVVGESAKLVGNIPGSAVQLGKGIVSFLNPLNTLKTAKAVIKSDKEAKAEGVKTIDVFKEMPKAAYETLIPKFARDLISGNTEEAQRTLVNDPVGQIAPFIIAAKAIATKAGVGAKFDKAMSDIAKPVTAPVKFIGKKAIEYGKQSLGVTTGVGTLPLEEAYKSGKTKGTTEFKKGIKGEISPKEILNTAETALNRIKEKRSVEYQTRFAEISKTKGAIDITPIAKELNTQLSKFRIKINKNGKLDFSESPIRNKADAVSDIKTLYEDIVNWKDKTPAGIDALKKGFDPLYSGTSPVRSVIQAVRSATNNLLAEKVPGYKEMTSGYENVSNLLTELKKDFGLGGTTGTSSMVQRLTRALKQDNQFKTDLINELERSGGVELTQQIGGTALSPYIGKGLIGKFVAPGAIIGAITGLINPKLLVTLLVSSPHIVGNFIQALGFSSRIASQVIQWGKKNLVTPEVTRSIMFMPKTKSEESR